jgi:uncharacterized protein
MKIALVGASGFVGKAVLHELTQRGHQVTAIVRNSANVEGANSTVQCDVNDSPKFVEAVKGHDAVVSAYNAGWQNPNLYADFIAGSKAIQNGAKQAGVKRLLVVGGAGSLFIDGHQLVDSPQFPAEWKAGATAARDYLTELRNEQELDWTFLSPAIELHPGTRTGSFRLGGENPVFDANGKCAISVEDLAVAIVDELEQGKHKKARFTVGY